MMYYEAVNTHTEVKLYMYMYIENDFTCTYYMLHSHPSGFSGVVEV